MKKISVLALAVTMSVALFAQETQPKLVTPMAKTTRFGLRAGVNLADLRFKDLPSGSPITEAQSKTSFNAGAFVNIPLGSVVHFQPEVSFSSQGGKLQGPSASGATTYGEQDLHYINVPLNFQFMATNGLFVQTGPQVGYLVAAKVKNVSGVSGETDNKDAFDHIDFSWGAGVGYLSRIGLGIDLRFNYGIANIMEDNNTSNLKGTVKNNVGQFSLIYQFGAYK
jgi:hypothetical protein